MQKIILKIIMLLFIVPTTVVAAIFTIIGIPTTLTAIAGDPSLSGMKPFYGLALMGFGWFGIYTLWQLYSCLLNDSVPEKLVKICFGLVAGTSVSIILIYIFGGTLLFRLTLFGWPNIASLVFILMLIQQKKVT